MIYGYARVSTTGQQHGSSLADQEEQLRRAGAEEIRTEIYTGKVMDRPVFTQLMAELKHGDKLVVTKLDRFARTAAEGVQTIEELLARGVIVQVLDMGVIDGSPMGRLMVTMLLAFAEFERTLILERCQAGKDAARARGVRVDGRPKKYCPEKIQLAISLLNDGHSYKQVERMTGISKSTLIRAVKENTSLG